MVFSRWHVLWAATLMKLVKTVAARMRRNNLISTGTGKHHFYDDDTPKVVREGEK